MYMYIHTIIRVYIDIYTLTHHVSIQIRIYISVDVYVYTYVFQAPNSQTLSCTDKQKGSDKGFKV